MYLWSDKTATTSLYCKAASKPRQCVLYFPNLFLRVGIHITMWCASGVWDFQNLTVYHSNQPSTVKEISTMLEELFHNVITRHPFIVKCFQSNIFHGGLCLIEVHANWEQTVE